MEKSTTLTTEIHSLWQDYNYNTARQGFHYKWGLNLGGTQFFPAGANHGQVSSPLGICLICLQIGKAMGGGRKRGEKNKQYGFLFSVSFKLKLKDTDQQKNNSLRSIRDVIKI